jgi:hypothetical protein
VSLRPEDYWAFETRLMVGERPTKAQHFIRFVVTIISWTVVGIIGTYIYRVLLKGTGNLMNWLIPVLLTIAVVWVFAQIITARQRKRLSPILDGFVLGEKTFSFDHDGFDEDAKNYHARFSWAAVRDLIDGPNHIFMMLDTNVGHIIPKRCFDSDNEANEFLSSISQLREQFAQNAT